MKIKKHYKLIISIVLVFISGLLIGGGVAHLIARHKENVDPFKKFRARAFKVMVEELNLTPEQQVKVGVFLDKALERMKKFRVKHASGIIIIIKENNQDLAKILTPEQWVIYQGYRNKTLDKLREKM